MAIHAARERGCRVTTTTISSAQHELAVRRVAEAGLSDLVEVLEQDYRTLRGTFDRIVSIEMLEAIGHDQLPTYFGALDRLLAPNGVVAIQTITIPEQRYRSYRRSEDWLRRHIFPGGLLPSVGEITRVCARASRLGVYGLEEIGPHYVTTLERWRVRFLEQLDEVRALGFDERFCRTWEFYLAYCEAAFASRAIRDVQLVLARPFERAGADGRLRAIPPRMGAIEPFVEDDRRRRQRVGPRAGRQHREPCELGRREPVGAGVAEPVDGRQLRLALELAAHARELLEVALADVEPDLLRELAACRLGDALAGGDVSRARVVPGVRGRVLVRAAQLPEHAVWRQHDHVDREVHERRIGVAGLPGRRADGLAAVIDDDEELVRTIGDAQLRGSRSRGCSSPVRPWRRIFSLRVARSMTSPATTPQKRP